MPTPDEIERARAAVSVACLRWLQPVAVAAPPSRRVPDEDGLAVFRRLDLSDERWPRDHPLWDRWLDS